MESIELIDLPSEILLMIFTKLNTIDAFDSLTGIHERIDKILQDRRFTNRLTLFKWSSDEIIYPLCDKAIDRLCAHILPKIHDKIKWLSLEVLSIERILFAAIYPNLSGLSLYNIDMNTAEHLFHRRSSVLNTFKNQISSLVIKFDNDNLPSKRYAATDVFTCILTMFINLSCLNFHPSSLYWQHMSFDVLRWERIFSSNILELYVNLKNFDDCLFLLDDCLFLLDDHFDELRILYVNISAICSGQTIDNQEKLIKLKCFSLTCNECTTEYDELIMQLLNRMSNLEEIYLNLSINRNENFVDDNDLKNEIINYYISTNATKSLY